ncbi:MAG TPA: hypothetical protein VGB55_10785, partial [Tepidisphaeraceae bacterium]
LSEEGQRLWTYEAGTKNAAGELIGPEKYTLRRLPIHRSFYPSTAPAIQAQAAEHAKHAADDLTDPTIDPYTISQQFVYYPRWTGSHFGAIRDIIRSMCMDSGEELRPAWKALNDRGQAQSGSLGGMPTVTMKNKQGETKTVPLTWRTAPDIVRAYDSLEYSRAWTAAFREQYRKVAAGEALAADKR